MGMQQPNDRSASGMKSRYENDAKKTAVKKSKTEMESQPETEVKDEEKPQVKCEESDEESDSEPSEDNLEDDEIMALIPKKFGKRKFLKGFEEKVEKKKKKPKEIKKKKPETELMPCLQSKRKEIEERRK